MRRKTALLLTLCLLLTVTASACSNIQQGLEQAAKGAIQAGSWSEDSTAFTNEWAGITVTLPDGWRAYSEEEMNAQFAAGEDIVVNSGAGQLAMDVAKLKTVYDFMVAMEAGAPNVIVSYENLSLTPGGSSLDEEGFYEALKPQLLAVAELEYAEVGTETKTVAGQSYFVATFTMLGGVASQDYYLRKIDNAMMAMIVTYTDETKLDADEFIAAIKAVD